MNSLELWIFAGMLPRRSSSVCILTAPLLYLPNAHAARTMLVEIVVGVKRIEDIVYRYLSNLCV